jgi:hypothetical protein
LSCELDASRPSVLLNSTQALESIKDNTNRINFDISKQKVNPRSKSAPLFYGESACPARPVKFLPSEIHIMTERSSFHRGFEEKERSGFNQGGIFTL